MLKPAARFQVVAVVVTFLLSTGARAGAPEGVAPDGPDDGPVAISPAANVDENLFLMRALESTYDRWPGAAGDPAAVQAALAQTRGRVSRLRATVRAHGLDPDVGMLYDDCLRLMDTYETYLANAGAIDRSVQRQEEVDAAAVTGTLLSEEGGFWDAVVEAYDRNQQRDQAKDAALDAEKRRLQAAWTDVRANAEAVAEKLTRVHGWAEGEAGFDNFQGATWTEHVQRRPRDPFLQLRIASARRDGETPTDLMNDARRCLIAASWVPAGRAYDGYRLEFVASAATLATNAAAAELPDKAYSAGPAPSATEAIRLCRTWLALDPADAAGRGHGHMQLARALSCARRYHDAVAAADKVIEQGWRDAGFCFRYARLNSLIGRPAGAGEWLAQAFRLGVSDVDFVRVDRDLSNFRNSEPERFRQLTTVTWNAGTDLGTFWDDILLRNDSPFDLTNITFDVTVVKDGQSYTRTLTLPSLKSGAEHKFSEDLFPVSSCDEFSTSLRCDQSVD